MKRLLLITTAALLIGGHTSYGSTTEVRLALERLVVSLDADTEEAKADLDRLAMHVKALAALAESQNRTAVNRAREDIVKARMAWRLSLQAIDINMDCWNFDARALQGNGMEKFYETMTRRYQVNRDVLRKLDGDGYLPSEIAVAYRLTELHKGTLMPETVLRMRVEEKGWSAIAKAVGATSLAGILDFAEKPMMATQPPSMNCEGVAEDERTQ